MVSQLHVCSPLRHGPAEDIKLHALADACQLDQLQRDIAIAIYRYSLSPGYRARGKAFALSVEAI